MSPADTFELLRHDVKAWNKWRSSNGNVVNLARANLAQTDLSLANLSGVLLAGANLREANLPASDLSAADLSGADLSGANLDGSALRLTDLRGAYLMYASARDTDLHMANLNGTNLTGADLEGANLQSAIFLESVLADLNLTQAKGLDFCTMLGPSIIDHRTVIRSNGLPVSFLRGCGLSDDLIHAYRALKPKFASCFISYSGRDEIFARNLYSSLQERGIRCWFSPEDLPIGGKIRPILDKEVLSRDKVLLILSTNALRSGWVEKEVETAFERMYKERSSVLLPIRLDDSVFETSEAWAADIRRSIHIGDFRDWQHPIAYERALERLLRDLQVGEPEAH
jgi:hypothetical protein